MTLAGMGGGAAESSDPGCDNLSGRGARVPKLQKKGMDQMGRARHIRQPDATRAMGQFRAVGGPGSPRNTVRRASATSTHRGSNGTQGTEQNGCIDRSGSSAACPDADEATASRRIPAQLGPSRRDDRRRALPGCSTGQPGPVPSGCLTS